MNLKETMMSEKVRPMGIAALHASYADGVRPEQMLDAVYARIAEVADPGIFLALRAKADVAREASQLPPFNPEAFPLWGIPFAVKDNIDVHGLPTTAGCPAFAYEPAEDAHVISRLRAAGALVIGKTNLDQFATGLVGVRTPYPVPRNALDEEIVPGGSSSGSAVAVAQGIVTFALGTDTAGSGRVPAALNNIVGVKPTLGLVSTRGVVPACRTLDTVSVFSAGVEDGWTVLRAAAGYDKADAYSRDLPSPALDIHPAPVIGVPDADSRVFFGDSVQEACFDAALQRLVTLGARLVQIDFAPLFAVANMLYEGAWVAERMAAVENLIQTQPEALHPVTRGIIGAAERLTAVDAFRGQYRLADLKRIAEPVLAGVDLLCVPTIPTFYTCADLAADPVGPNSRLGTYTNFVNLMDMCGLAVPTSPRADGRPGSVTLLAPHGCDGMLVATAARIEADSDVRPGAGLARPSPMSAATGKLRPNEMVVAAVGAHMSGLPLNNELTDLDARCLGPAQTAEVYRLFRLPGNAVAKPGLLRVSKGGASLEVELWAMDSTRIGRFLRGISAPLSLGTLELADGATCTGFLVEAAAVEGAEDITAHGGWRAFLASELTSQGSSGKRSTVSV